MTTKLNLFNRAQLKRDLPDIRPGDTVRIHQKIKEGPPAGGKERIQVFEGQVIAKKHGKGISSTVTVRKEIGGVGVERIFSIHSPTIEKIELIKKGKVRRAKLYYLRKAKGRKAKLKKREFVKTGSEKKLTGEMPEERGEEKNKPR